MFATSKQNRLSHLALPN